MKIIRITVSSLAVVVGLTTTAFGQVFSEDFGTIADGTAITTTNTDLTYVRTGTSAVAPDAINPSSFGTSASAFVQAAGGSLTGIGVGNTLPSSSVYTFSADFRFTNVTAGDIVFGVGSGTSFTGNSTFTTSHGLFWLQSNNGNFERRTGSWNDVGTGTTFANGVNYSLHAVANGSAGSVTYGSRTLNAGSMDLYLNGALVDGNVVVTNSLAADGFRIYSVNGTGVEIDNIAVWNSAQAIPEPSTYAVLFGAAALSLAMVRRRFGRGTV